MANENLVTITVTRDRRVMDAGAGFSDGTPQTIYSGPAKFFPAFLTSSQKREEGGEGITTQTMRWVKIDKPVSFTSPATDFRPQDVISVNGRMYRVDEVDDEYAHSVQLQVFRLH